MVGFGAPANRIRSIWYSQAAATGTSPHSSGARSSRVALVGNSMGGATALGVAMDRPELVDRLVLMGSAGLNAAITPSLEPIVYYDYTLEGMRRLIAALTNPRFRASEDLIRARHARSVEPDTRRAYTATMGWVREQGGLFYPENAIAPSRRRRSSSTARTTGSCRSRTPIGSWNCWRIHGDI